MMTKKILLYWILAGIAFIGLTSCEEMFGDYLDQAPSSELPEEDVWSNIDYVIYFHNDIYNFQRSGFAYINNSWIDAATDLAETSYPSGGVESSLNVGNYYSGSGAPELVDSWSHYYAGIRKVNMFLERIGEVPLKQGESQTDRDETMAALVPEARYLRASFYWELMKRYGGVPIITETLSSDDEESLMVSRSSFDQCFNYVVGELNAITNELPVKYSSANRYKGRPTRGAVLGLKAEMQLFYASPLFNPNNELKRWENAMNTAKQIIDLGQYQLDTDFGRMFNYPNSKELIHVKYLNQGNWWPSESPVGYGGFGGLCPTQNLVDLFDMKNGQPAILGYNSDGSPIINQASGYNPNKPYENRDPRFYATVLYNGANWWQRPIETFTGGLDRPAGNTDATQTGYYNRKFMDDKATHPINGGSVFRNWIFLRYADVLLMYAEARNEFSGPDAQVYDVLDQLRSRGGTGITEPMARNYNKTQLREFIKKERAVELAFEGKRWWDLKRWKDGDVLNQTIYGMRITQAGSGYNYERIVVEDRYFEDRMYLYPIPRNEMYINPNLENNPGW